MVRIVFAVEKQDSRPRFVIDLPAVSSTPGSATRGGYSNS